MKTLTREEQETVLRQTDYAGDETIISTNEAEDVWLASSASRRWNNRLEKIGAEKLKEDGYGTNWRLQMNMLTLRKQTQEPGDDDWEVCSASPIWNRHLERIGAQFIRKNDTHSWWRVTVGSVSLHSPTIRSNAQLAVSLANLELAHAISNA